MLLSHAKFRSGSKGLHCDRQYQTEDTGKEVGKEAGKEAVKQLGSEVKKKCYNPQTDQLIILWHTALPVN